MTFDTNVLDKLGVLRREMTLENGLAATLYERPGQPISIRMAFQSGARYDPAGKDGLSHFAEHMVLAGTKTYPSKDLLAQYIEQYGGVFGATTDSELLNINIQIADAEDLPKATHLLDEMLNLSLFNKETFITERGSVLRELGDQLSSPSRVLWNMYYPLFFQDSILGRSVIGSEETIRAIQVKDIKQFFTTQLGTSRAHLIVSGGATMDAVANAFGSIPMRIADGLVPRVKPAVRSRKTPVMIRPFTINDQVDFVIGFRTCGLLHPDKYALKIIQTILGGGRAATLIRKLRYEKGFIYGGGALNDMVNDLDGAWIFKSACAKKDFQDVLDVICSEFQRVYQGGITDDEISFAKGKIIKSLEIHLQTSEEWVDFHTEDEVYGKGTADDYVRAIAGADLKAVAEVGKKYFQPGQWYLGLAGDITESGFKVNY